MDGSFIIATGLASEVIIGSGSRGAHDHITWLAFEIPPNLEVTVLKSSTNRVAQLTPFPRKCVPFFVAPFDSEGYGGGI